MNNTLNYYNNNAESFIDNTFLVNMENLYPPFLRYVKKGDWILDVGCGSGRDSLYFKTHGYNIEAFDYSPELVQLAQEKTGLPIRLQSFYDLDEHSLYDGVWACASLLHCARHRLPEVMQKLINALKIDGICYLSFKYGENDRADQGREFTDLNEQQAQQLLKSFNNILLLQQWITIDNRPDHDESWLNIIIRKVENP